MSKNLKILQIGIDNWKHSFEIPDNMDWYYFCPDSSLALRKMMEMDGITSFHVVLIEDGQYLKDLLPFMNNIEPHTLFGLTSIFGIISVYNNSSNTACQSGNCWVPK